MPTDRPLALVAGAGAGLGQHLFSNFEDAGYGSVGMGRNRRLSTTAAFHEVNLSGPDLAQHLMARITPMQDPPIIAPETTPEPYQCTSPSIVQSAVLLAQSIRCRDLCDQRRFGPADMVGKLLDGQFAGHHIFPIYPVASRWRASL